MARPEVYVSIDIEADGPIPGPHSMLSLGAVALLDDGTELGTFSANLETLAEASPHPETMAWWATQPEAWQECRRDLEAPEPAMRRFVQWVGALPGRPVFVGYPASFDFLFVHWYLMRFVGQTPFSHSALDIKTFAMALLGCGYRDAVKKAFPRRWRAENAHLHVALDDAREQGAIFVAMLRECRTRHGKR